MRNNFVLPLLFGLAFLLFSALLPALKPESAEWWKYGAFTLGVALLVLSYFVAKNDATRQQTRGGSGGKAKAPGEKAEAEGGAGGNANGGVGGDGGNALATGKGARARGGAGGTG